MKSASFASPSRESRLTGCPNCNYFLADSDAAGDPTGPRIPNIQAVTPLKGAADPGIDSSIQRPGTGTTGE